MIIHGGAVKDCVGEGGSMGGSNAVGERALLGDRDPSELVPW
jgi:hypothetical protein